MVRSIALRRLVGYLHRMGASQPTSNEPVRDQNDFYVEPNCCLLCGVPEGIAPEIFRTGEHNCSMIRQPCSEDEIDRTIRAMWSSEVDCVRYRGRDAAMLKRLARAGMAGQTDHGDASASSVSLRDQVTFVVPESAVLKDASQVAKAFRQSLRMEGKKVLPAWLGRRSVWLSWYRNRFHLVRFADVGHRRIVARLQWAIATQGPAWLVDDWLRAQSVVNIRWEAADDPLSASSTPM